MEHSKFFRAGFNGKFGEAVSKDMQLHGIDPAAYATYVQWMYSGKIVVMEPDQVKTDENGEKRYLLLAKLYVVADQLENRHLRNQTMTDLVEVLKSTNITTGASAISLAYERTPEKSALRRFMVDSHLITSGKAEAERIRGDRSQLPACFILDVALRLLEN